jgi:ribosomal protein S18 acetylase RimI-like enzyme
MAGCARGTRKESIMSLRWIRESPGRWDADKARIVGMAPKGVFDTRFAACKDGDLLPAEWWRVEHDGKVVGYGWLDVVWGDAEILLATGADAGGRGVGTFILEQLESEARERGLRYLYNIVRPTHPRAAEVTRWLQKRGFRATEDGRLLRAVPALASPR